jgi:hypothetical protein
VLNDDFYITNQLDSVDTHLMRLQNMFLSQAIDALRRMTPSQLANRKLVQSTLKEVLATFNNVGVLTGRVSKFIDDSVNFETSIVIQRLESAYAVGSIGGIPSLRDNIVGKQRVIKRAKQIQTVMLANKVADIVANVSKNSKKLSSGAITTDEVITKAIIKVADTPWVVPVRRADGAVSFWSADARMTLELRNEVKNIAIARTNDVINRSSVNLVEVSSHANSRPDHADWQGEVFWLHTPVHGYRPFSVCGEGYADGFGGVNCRHRKAPFFEDINEPPSPDSVDHKAYEATQELRRLERRARELTQKKDILSKVGAVDGDLLRRQSEAVSESYRFAYSNGLRPRL